MIEIWVIAFVATLAIVVTAHVYYAFLLMGHLEVWHRRLWEKLGSPMPTKVFNFKFLGWMIRGGYKQMPDLQLIALGRKANYLLLACLLLVVIG